MLILQTKCNILLILSVPDFFNSGWFRYRSNCYFDCIHYLFSYRCTLYKINKQKQQEGKVNTRAWNFCFSLSFFKDFLMFFWLQQCLTV